MTRRTVWFWMSLVSLGWQLVKMALGIAPNFESSWTFAWAGGTMLVRHWWFEKEAAAARCLREQRRSSTDDDHRLT